MRYRVYDRVNIMVNGKEVIGKVIGFEDDKIRIIYKTQILLLDESEINGLAKKETGSKWERFAKRLL